MLKIIHEEEAVARYRKQFVRKLRSRLNEKIPVKVGHQGASFPARVNYSGDLDIWMGASKSGENRHGHVFGTNRPAPSDHVSIVCEINFPASGIDRKIGAAFARDPGGKIFAVHRGRIGGGQRGIGKSLFSSRYRGVWAEMDEEGQTVAVAVIGELGSPRFPRQVAQFVHKVARIKEAAAAAASPQTAMPLEAWGYAAELTGERYEDMRQDLSRECDHGLIVRDLAAALKALGLRAGNDSYRDLFAVDGQNRPTVIFQVNTESRTKRIQEGVTRLFFSSLSYRQPCRLILVLPEPLEEALAMRLRGLNIAVLIYEWDNQQAAFPDLERLITTSS